MLKESEQEEVKIVPLEIPDHAAQVHQILLGTENIELIPSLVHADAEQ